MVTSNMLFWSFFVQAVSLSNKKGFAAMHNDVGVSVVDCDVLLGEGDGFGE